jgi:hypothetical protein
MNLRRSLQLLSLATVIGLLAACSSNSATAPTTTKLPVVSTTHTAAPETSVPDTAAPDTITTDTYVPDTFVPDTTDTTLSDGPGVGTPFCTSYDELNNTDSPMDNPEATPAEYAAFFGTQVPNMLKQLAAVTPPALKADVATMSAGITTIGQIYARNNWDTAKATVDPAWKVLTSSTDYRTAFSHIDAYCAINS